MEEQICGVLSAGYTEYSLDEAKIPIQDLIDALESAKGEGATHIVQASGNHRGAQWVRLSDHIAWADE